MRAPEVRTPGGSGQASADQETSQQADCACNDWSRQDESAARAEVERHDKRVSTAQARAAIAGYAAHIVSKHGSGSEFLVLRWQFSRTLPTIEALEQWIDVVAGVRA